MAHLLRLSAALVLSTLAACGGKSFEAGEPDPTPGGTNAGGTGSGGSNQGGSGNTAGKQAGGSTSKGGTGSAGTGQGGSAGSTCERFDDEPGYFVGVVIINKTSAPIHLGQDMVNCGVSPLFEVTEASGGQLPPPGSCRSTCRDARTNGPVGCPAFCAFPSSIALQPGEVTYTSYSGLYEVQTVLPQQCVDPTFGVTSCSQAKQIQPGAFTFSARAGSSIDCNQTTGGACNPCMASGQGGCTTPGSLISGKMHSATTTVFLDYSYGVFGSSPAPAPAFPGNPAGDTPGGALALRSVELVFVD